MEIGQVLFRISHRILEAGSLRKMALEWGISAPYLSDVVRGRRNPGPSILKHFNLKAVKTCKTVYVPIVNCKLPHTSKENVTTRQQSGKKPTLKE